MRHMDKLFGVGLLGLEAVYLYRTRLLPAQARRLFLDDVRDINRLVEQPTFYNTRTSLVLQRGFEGLFSTLDAFTRFSAPLLLTGRIQHGGGISPLTQRE